MMIDVPDLGYEEVKEINAANVNIFGFNVNAVGYSVFEPVYKFVLFVWLKMTAFSVYGMRSFSAIAVSIGAGILFENFWKRVHFRMACWVSLFYFLNNVFLFQSQNIGNVSLALLVALISVFTYIDLYRNPDTKNTVILALVNSILFFVANAWIGLILFQLLFSLLYYRKHYKTTLLSFFIFVLACNYPLIKYFSENNLLEKQLNIGLYYEYIEKTFLFNFADDFFMNLASVLIIALTLNIFMKKLSLVITDILRWLYRFFLLSFFVLFIFLSKSEIIKSHDLEIPMLSYYALAFSVLAGMLLGNQKFHPKINLIVFLGLLLIFIPSLQFGKSKNWPSKTLVKYIENNQDPKTLIAFNDFFPFLFYLAEEDFKQGNCNNSDFTYKNVKRLNLTRDIRDIVGLNNYDTYIIILNKEFNETLTDSLFEEHGFLVGNDDFGNYKIKTFHRN
jgi:hypothetical protein